MSVTVQDLNGTRRVSVLGDMTDAADGCALLDALAKRGPGPIELTFYDARTLPAEVLEELLNLKTDALPVKIHAYHGYLVHHLANLGLPVLGMLSAAGPAAAPEYAAVVLGGSADSLDKVFAIVEALPPSQAAVFIVQHILEEEPNYLDRLLRVRTEYAVEMPQHMTAIRPGSIYVAPPGYNMRVAHGRVYLTQDRKVNYARPSIDALFESVAGEYKERCLGVLLCGYGRDGVAGLAAIKAGGGCALIEDSADCAARDLTDAGIAGGGFDHVLSLPELRCYLAAALAGRNQQPSDQLVGLLLEAVYSRYGYDYRNYQRSTVQRRLANIYSKLAAPDFFALQREILTDSDAFEQLFLELSINVTAFFRHPGQFKLLREKVLPYLDSFPQVKIWSAGCAAGEEAYSLAIVLDELHMLHKSLIFATDINPYQLEEAKNGLYPMEMLEEGRRNYAVSGGPGRLDDWLALDKGCMKIAPRLRQNILFYAHSLTHDGPFNEFQLIVCRNVLIYFHPVLQQRVMDLFSRSLHQEGFLMLGPSEQAATGGGASLFSPYASAEKIYRWGGEGLH